MKMPMDRIRVLPGQEETESLCTFEHYIESNFQDWYFAGLPWFPWD